MNNVKKSIAWTDFTINPIKGLCPVACPYCYARSLYRRFGWNPEIRFDMRPLLEVAQIKKPSRIFVGSTMELFGPWVDAFWLESIFKTVRDSPRHTFIFLTKRPESLVRWSPFPDNAWVGFSATNQLMWDKGLGAISNVVATVRLASVEPFLEPIRVAPADMRLLNWLIIGGQSGPKKFYPPEDWIRDIEAAADKIGIPVFEKNNLRPGEPDRRQEWPKEARC